MEIDESRHHCPEPECGGPSGRPIKNDCYRKLHLALCCVIIETKTRHLRFCGHRFQVESPKACALHHWGPNNENKFYQLAKKGLPYDLPSVFPHEQPDWEMVLSGYGSIRSSVAVRMGMFDNRKSFVRVISYDENAVSNEVALIAHVSNKEVLMGVDPPYPGEIVAPEEIEADTAAAKIQVLAKTEMQDEAVFNDAMPWLKYNMVKTNARAATEWGAQAGKKQKVTAAAAALRTSVARSYKKGGDARFLQTTKKKKRN